MEQKVIQIFIVMTVCSIVQVLDFFREINESMHQIIVMVSHEDWHKDYFHHIVRLSDGKIVSDGINGTKSH